MKTIEKIEKAKKVLFNILDKQEYFGDSCQIAQFRWRRNYGVFKDLLFHATDDNYYFENSLGLRDFFEDEQGFIEDPLSQFDPLFDRGALLFKAHIVIFHKGYVKYILEIVDKKDVEQEKLEAIDTFFSSGVSFHQIEADVILKINDFDKLKILRTKELIEI